MLIIILSFVLLCFIISWEKRSAKSGSGTILKLMTLLPKSLKSSEIIYFGALVWEVIMDMQFFKLPQIKMKIRLKSAAGDNAPLLPQFYSPVTLRFSYEMYFYTNFKRR